MGELREDQIDLSKVVAALRQRLLVVIGTAIACALITLLVVWILPPIYEARALLLVPQDDDGKAALNILTEKTQTTDVLRGVLISHTAEEALRSLTTMKPKDFEKAYDVESDPTTDEITISFKDKKPQEVLAVVQKSIEELDSLNRDVGFTRAGRQAEEYQKALDARQKELDAAESDLVNQLQRSKTTVVSDPLTSAGSYIKEKNTLQADYAAADLKLRTLQRQVGLNDAPEVQVPIGTIRFKDLREKLTNAELDLRLKLATFQEDSPEVKESRQTLEETRKDLQQEISRYIKSVQSGTSDEALALLSNRTVLGYQLEQAKEIAAVAPAEAQKFYTLINKVGLINRQVQEISAQLSAARIQASVDKIRYSVLDQPYLLDRPTNKNYPVYGIVALVGGAALGLILAYWLNTRPRTRPNA